MQKLLNKLGVTILLGLILISAAWLFFEDKMTILANLFSSKIGAEMIDSTGRELKIAYLFEPSSLNPFSGDAVIQSRLADVYQGLVKIDENMTVRPSLAVAYGLKNNNQWDFILRRGVKFHNGADFTADDVVYSYQKAKEINDSGLAELFADIESMEKVDDFEIRFIAQKNDPLFLNKLSKLLIVPKDFLDFQKPIGTGAYQIANADDLKNISYSRFDNYWGRKPYFPKIKIVSISTKTDRVEALVNGSVDILVDVPPDAVDQLKAADKQIKLMPSLEVGMVMFNIQDTLLSNKLLRQAIAMAINKDSFLDLTKGYAKTVNQFVSNGVFGYNPEISGYPFDETSARDLISQQVSGFQNIKLTFSYPQNLKMLGQYFKEQLQLVGIDLELNPLSDQDLMLGIQQQKFQFYYLGWRSDLGDALPFLRSVIAYNANKAADSEEGLYNGAGYDNQEVNDLIKASSTDFNLQERLKKMQEVMRIAVEDDIVGVPIFETESIFAMNKEIDFSPRVDSLVYPSDISVFNSAVQ